MFGYGKPQGRNTNVDFDDFGQVLTSLGIDKNASQEQLWKIYGSAKDRGDVKVTGTLDKYFDWWN